MKAHVIENNIVTNTIIVDSLDFLPNLVEATEGGIGWSYVDGVFTAPADTRTDEEIASIVRRKRNIKLTESDWTQVDDAPVNKAAWATYRQALRDVPAQTGFPWTIEWPTQPE
jgi:hypothetical protein